jgi:hypothetical protein
MKTYSGVEAEINIFLTSAMDEVERSSRPEWLKCEADHSSPSSAEVKDGWSYDSAYTSSWRGV